MSSTMIGCPRDWSRYDRLGNQKSRRNNLNNKCRRGVTVTLILGFSIESSELAAILG